MLPACFTHERKHKTFKGYATATTRLAGYEKSVAISMLNQQLRDLRDGSCLRSGTFLVGARRHHGVLEEALGASRVDIARTASCNTLSTSTDDLVFVAAGGPGGPLVVAKVLLHVDVDPTPANTSGIFTMVSMYAPVGDATDNTWSKVSDDRVLVPIEHVVGATIWTTTRAGVRVIKPAYMEYWPAH